MSRARKPLRAALWQHFGRRGASLARALAAMGWTTLTGTLLQLNGCDSGDGATHIPAPEVAKFELEAYPVLLRDCGFPACHGSHDRFFRVFGPGRSRLLETTPMFSPATADELSQSYARARSMLSNQGSVLESWLLRNPLAASAGGAHHGGEDHWGRNVYQNADAPGYLTIRAWALSHEKTPGSAAAQ
jgi:hypothetical protein